MAGMRVTVVGCAGSFPGPDSPASCYLLEAEGFRLVIDLGNGALGVLQRFAGLFSIDAICLSHLHDDHCIDMGAYWVARQYAPDGSRPPIPVYGPRDTAAQVVPDLGPGAEVPDGSPPFGFCDLKPGTTEIGPFRVTADRVNHPVETFGFRFSHGGRTIAYTGDTGETEEVPLLARDCDVFLSEAAFLDGPDLPPNLHLSARQAAGYALRAGAGKLVLTHLQPWTDADKALAEAAAVFDGALTVAASGQLIAP